jgi:hypothetical protein
MGTNGIYEDEEDGFLDYEIEGEGEEKNESSNYFYVKSVKIKEDDDDDEQSIPQFEEVPLSGSDKQGGENTKIEKM